MSNFIVDRDYSKIKIGEILDFNSTSGKKIEILVCDKTREGVLFITRDCIAEHYMNSINTVKDGYEASDLREYINSELIKLFPNEIKSKMKSFKNGDLLRIPTEKEIFGVNKYGALESENIKQFESMKEDKYNRIAFYEDHIDWYWLTNVSRSWSRTAFSLVNNYGFVDGAGASCSFGVRILFLLEIA